MVRAQKNFFDREAEQSVIGSVLIDSSAMNKLADRLKIEDFGDFGHRDIWSAMLDLYAKKQPIDLMTLTTYSERTSAAPYLASCMNMVPSSANVEWYADKVLNLARLRVLLEAAGKINAVVYEERDADIAVDRARSILMDATQSEKDSRLINPVKQGDLIRTVFEGKRHGSGGIPSGFHTLDTLTGGLHRGDLIVIAGRTSTGKSTFAENLAEQVAMHNHSVLFVSLEMSPEQLMYRFAVRNGTMSNEAVEFGPQSQGDKDKLEQLAIDRTKLPMYLLDMPSASPMSIRSAVNRVMSENGPLDLVVVDYLQIMGGAYSQQEHLRIGEITKTLKQMAREFKITVVLLSQLNRNIELRGGEPKLADLRDSGKIEEDSDIVILLWRMDKPDASGNSTMMKVEKNRNGAIGKLAIRFNPPYFKFYEHE
jgi:replicative DNA helicase